MICGPPSCGCAIQSSTLSVTGSGTPSDPWVVEQAEFTDITALQADVAALEAWRTTAEGQISALETDNAANVLAITRLDAMVSGVVNQSGAGVGPTSGTTALVLATVALGPFNVAGRLLMWGSAMFTKTVATDTFSFSVRLDGATVSQAQDRTNQAGASLAAPNGSSPIAASDTPTVDITLQRSTGTGTATTLASVLGGRFSWAFIPS